MPLFVFVSAFLVTKVKSLERHGCKKYILSRAIKLFVPYVFMSLIGILPKILLRSFINDNIQISFTYFIKAFFVPRYNIWGHFWFIPMIFIFAVITIPYISLIKKSKTISILLCIASFGLLFVPDITEWFGLNDVKNYLCWYLLGLILGDQENFENVLKVKIISLILVICSVAVYYLKFFPYRPIVAALMIFFVLYVSIMFNIKRSKFMQKIEKCNYTIYILSWPIQALIEIVANKVFGLHVIICMFLMFIFGISIPILITLILNWLNKKINVKFLNLIVGF